MLAATQPQIHERGAVSLLYLCVNIAFALSRECIANAYMQQSANPTKEFRDISEEAKKKKNVCERQQEIINKCITFYIEAVFHMSTSQKYH